MKMQAVAAMVALVLCAPCATVHGADATPSAPAAPGIPAGQKWVFAMGNLATDKGLAQLIDIASRAGKAGYNGFMIADIKMEKFQLQSKPYVDNVARFRQVCKENNLKLIVCVTPFGYSDVILSNDPNLAEGMPVRDATFVVKNGKLVPDEKVELINGAMEEWKGNVPVGWNVDEPGKISFRDEAGAKEGKTCLRQQDVAAGDKAGRGRMYQKIKVIPWHYYHVSVWVKSENSTSKDWRIFAYDGKIPLTWQAPPIQKTQDWTQHHATFCSLDNTELSLYVGTWNGKAGKVWFDDIRIEPAGFVNILRRESLPLTVRSADGKTTYEEAKDFARVADPKLDHDPFPGYFTNWHEAPAVAVPASSRLKEGDKVLASYHFAMTCGKPNNINMCMSEPKTYEIIENQIKWVKQNVQPDIYQLSHDEIRLNGWDDTCAKTGKTNGQILADNARRCVEIVKKVDPGKPIMIWNDMFDPHHNAKATEASGSPFTMYMAKGNWSGAWEGLSTDVAIGTWLQQSVPSVEFWSKRGHQVLLLGFYDHDPSKIGEWLKSTAHCKNLVGVMYTTWVGDYSKLDDFLGHVRKYEASTQPAN